MPLFRHNPIRLLKADLVNSRDGFYDTFVIQESEETSEVMSMMSYAESIFDISATMSTASSFSGDAQELISKFVDIP